MGGTMAVDGTASARTERDEQGRIFDVTSFDLLVSGDPAALVPVIRPTAGVVRESVETTTYKERRLRATFAVLRGPNALHPDLIEWQQSIDVQGEAMGPVDAYEFEGGAQPILVYSRKRVYRAVQQGRAVGLGRYPRPPGKLLPDLPDEDVPTVSRKPLNDMECETTWAYHVISTETINTGLAFFLALGRPANPQFDL